MSASFERYEILGALSQGAQGRVLRARDRQTGAEVALKVHSPLAGASSRSRERFLREAQVLSRLAHEALVRVHGVGEHQGVPFIALELIAGGSLQDQLDRRGPLPAREAAEGVLHLLGGLAHAHAAGVLHRDLKPANVLLDDGQWLLTDFGLALDQESEQERLSRTGSMMGTPGYWAPEQARGEKGVDARTDVFGMGATLYACLTGAPPYGGGSLTEVVAASLRPVSFPRQPAVDPGLTAICLRALAHDPGERFPSAEAFAAALEDWLDRAAGRSSPRAAVAGLGLLTLGAIGALGVVWARPQASATSMPAPTSPADSPAEGPADVVRRARALADAGDLDGCLRELDRALARGPNPELLVARARELYTRGRQEWRLDCERAAALAPTRLDLQAWRAWALVDPPERRRLIEPILAQEPDIPIALLTAAEIAFQLGDVWTPDPEALARIERALALDPDLFEALRVRAVIRFYPAFQAGDQATLREVFADLERSLALRPHDTNVLHMLGFFHFRCEDYQVAITYLQRATHLASNPEDYYYLGLAHERLGQAEAAYDMQTRAIELGGHPKHYVARGLAALRLARREQALDDAVRAIAISETTGDTQALPDAIALRDHVRGLLGEATPR